MRVLLIATAASMFIAAPAQAQLLGGVGGVVGGSGNIGVSGIGGGVSGTVDATSRATVRAPRVPRVRDGRPAVPARATVLRAQAAVPRVATDVIAVPAIPNVAVRRAAIIEAGIAPVAVVDVPAYVDNQYVVLERELRGTGVEVIKRQNQIVLEMPSDVTFAFNKHNIQPRFHGVLNAVSRTLSRYPAMYVDVNGHTDAVGSHAYNQVLSERRAGAVADYLADRSVAPARLHVEGFGKTEPIASNATASGRAANRRVEIVLTPSTS